MIRARREKGMVKRQEKLEDGSDQPDDVIEMFGLFFS